MCETGLGNRRDGGRAHSLSANHSVWVTAHRRIRGLSLLSGYLRIDIRRACPILNGLRQLDIRRVSRSQIACAAMADLALPA